MDFLLFGPAQLDGTTRAPDGDALRIYSGAADTSIAVATASVRAILQWLKERG